MDGCWYESLKLILKNMKSKILLILSCSFLLYSCRNKVETPYAKIDCIMLNDSIYTTMPGNLVLTPKYLVWSDPFAKEYFLHVHDTLTGKELGVMGKIGQGPEEFITPVMSQLTMDNQLYVMDVNGNNKGFFSIDSMLCGKKYYREAAAFKKDYNLSQMDSDIYIGNTDDEDPYYFLAVIKGKTKKFGSYPVPGINRHIGGNLSYDPGTKDLVYTSFDYPYIAYYQYDADNETFILKGERRSEVDNYDIVDGSIVFDWSKAKGASEVCMSKDYIITLERDKTRDKTDEKSVGRDISMRPTTVFLYDYRLNLERIVDLGFPIGRICASKSNNTLYVIGADPDYVIVKCHL